MNYDFSNFVKEAEEKATEIKVGGNSPIEFNNTLPCPDFKNLIPEYFTKIDGSKLMDTKTGDVFRLSQSFIASFREALINGTCLRRLYYGSVERLAKKKHGETEPMRLGTLFEFLLTGAFDYYGDKPEMKKKYVGGPKERFCDPDLRAKSNADEAKISLKDFDIDLEKTDDYNADKKFMFNCLDGSMDLHFLNDRIFDIKYSGILFDTWSKYAWDELGIEESFSKQIQSSLYSLLHILVTGRKASFDYIVFSNKAKELKEFQIFEVNISEERFNMLKWLLIDTANLFQSMINENKFIEKPSFDNCKGCPNLECKVRQVYRKKITVKI